MTTTYSVVGVKCGDSPDKANACSHLFVFLLCYHQAYYEGLFQAADVKRAGFLGGQEAVAFFSRSKLPTEVLKNIWTVADQPASNSLDRRKFFTAVRLIQLSQNGQKAQGATLAPPPGVTLRLPPLRASAECRSHASGTTTAAAAADACCDSNEQPPSPPMQPPPPLSPNRAATSSPDASTSSNATTTTIPPARHE